MELVTQAELAKLFKVSKPYISKLVRKGVFDNCFELFDFILYLGYNINKKGL